MTDKMVVGSEEWINDQIIKYKNHYPTYMLFAQTLELVLNQAAKKYAPLAIIQTRPKAISSFAEKCRRKQDKYKDPVNQLTDLCGGRVIVNTADEVEAISEFIDKHFEIDQENTINVSERLKPTEFGYRSVHYIVSFKKGVFQTKGSNEKVSARDIKVKVPNVLFGTEDFPNNRAEVQVRTVLEHAWADMAHELAYKNAFETPAKWEREFASVAAMLEGADKTFSRIKEGFSAYATSYGAYMTEEEMRDEVDFLEVVLEHDKRNIELAGRIGKLYIILEDWPKARAVLSGYKRAGEPAILRDLGIAICKMEKSKPRSRQYKQGQIYLEKACSTPHEDIDALASLAGTYKRIDDIKSKEYYQQAFLLDPSDPYPLENYLDMEIASVQDTSIVSLLNPVITAAIKRCNDQAEVGVNLPWAFYMMGKFNLLLNKPYASLEAYAKAIQLKPAPWMIGTTLESLERIAHIGDQLPGFEWARRFLLIGIAVTTNQKAKDAADELTKAKAAEEQAKLEINCKGTDEVAEKTVLNQWEQAKAAREAAEKAAKMAKETAKEALINLSKLALNKDRPIKRPVVIVAGGCDPSLEGKFKTYRELLFNAFSDYKGTVIGGGTKEGISGFIGEIGEKYGDAIHTIGYHPEPKSIPGDATRDERYSELRETEGRGHSPFESLQSWIDIIAAGFEPSEIKVLGINGGTISAIEYRIALALGATVGVVEESGREVARLLRDEKWVNSDKLFQLPDDVMTVSSFVEPKPSEQEPNIRVKLAKQIHENYLRTKKTSIKSEEPAMNDWDNIPDELKESNAQQADDIYKKLNKVGLNVQKVSGRKAILIKLTNEEIERLAEIEHGRWNVEKLNAGWTWGKKKDAVKKKSPYLVRWADLPEDVKQWDRNTVLIIPELLAELDLEVHRNTK